MSALTITLAVAAALVIALGVANAIAYRRRFGTFLRPSAGSTFRSEVPRSGVVVAFAGVLGSLAGLALPTLLPESAFATWLREPYAWFVYLLWCWLGMYVLAAAYAVCSHHAAKGNRDAQ